MTPPLDSRRATASKLVGSRAAPHNLARRTGPPTAVTVAKSTAAGPLAIERTQCTSLKTGTCAAVRSRALGLILSRFCRDPGLSRDNSPNSGSYDPLGDHVHHITNVQDLGGVPSAYQSNWLGANTFNSFRSGDVGQLPNEYADLQAEIIGVCEDECNNGTFFMAARVRNAGTIDAPAGLPVTVRAGVGGPIVVTLETLEPVPAGKTGEVLFFELPAAELADVQPVITVDDAGLGEGKLFECDELNNTAVWPDIVCPGGA